MLWRGFRRSRTNGGRAPIIAQAVTTAVLPQTIGGGSGRPVFGPDGTVIGVNFAVARDFGVSNFGVPIHFARELLP